MGSNTGFYSLNKPKLKTKMNSIKWKSRRKVSFRKWIKPYRSKSRRNKNYKKNWSKSCKILSSLILKSVSSTSKSSILSVFWRNQMKMKRFQRTLKAFLPKFQKASKPTSNKKDKDLIYSKIISHLNKSEFWKEITEKLRRMKTFNLENSFG